MANEEAEEIMKVIVAGATGKMGREVCRAVQDTAGLVLAGGVNSSGRSLDGVEIFTDLNTALKVTKPHVVVDFTTPAAIRENMAICLAEKVPMVIGTTGLAGEELEKWRERARKAAWRAIIAPNFAIGAVLMMEYAKQAASFFAKAEIIEYHHEQKLDAPSGTALKTKEMMQEVMAGDVPIHSVRLPGLVAHQEVILGLPGQTFTIRHDSTDRTSFMPGVLLAISKIKEIEGVVYGLEHILFSNI